VIVNKRVRGILLTGLMAIGAALAAVGTASTAGAATGEMCDPYGNTVQGGYVVMNNRWGGSSTHCINVTANGFQITRQDGVSTSGAPVSYPAIFLGCHYNTCSPDFTARRISAISSATSSISNTYPSGGVWDAAYDIWLNADSDMSGVQDTEIMIWLNHVGGSQPVGSTVGSVNLAGRAWTVWTGYNGANNVVSYVANSPTSNLSFNVLDFVRDTFSRGSKFGNSSWYLTSIQAGFEPWRGGVGLAVNSFSASVTGGTPPATTTAPPVTSPPVTSPTVTTPPVTTPPVTTTPPGPGACTATYAQAGSWGSGYQGTVTVRNGGSAAINGWTVRMTMPSGQSVTQLWNGTLSGSSGTVTVTNAAYNGSVGAGGTTSFGFIANGSGTAAPSALTCTTG
jgi:hypothetical protein